MARDKWKRPKAPAPAPAPAPGADPAAPFLAGWGPYAVIAAAAFLLYFRTLWFGFTLLDDNVFAGDKLAYLSRWSNALGLFTRGSFLGGGGAEVFYRPVLILSYMVDASLIGADIGLWHLLNILLHAGSALLVFSFFKRLGRPDRALLLALVFAVHPALAQAVAWIPGRTDTLLAVFVLAAVNSFMDYAPGGRPRALHAHLLLLALALMTKELAIAVPAVCLLYALLAAPRTPLPRLAAAAAGWLALLAAWHLTRAAILPHNGGYTAVSSVTSVLRNLPALFLYLGKAFVPAGYSTYPILEDARLGWGCAAALALAAGLALSRQADLKRAAWGAGWFVAMLLPSFVYPRESIVPVFYEYRLYLPLVGLLLVVGELDWVKGFDLSRKAHRLALAAVVFVLFGLAGANAYLYADSRAFWTRAVEVSPHSAFARKQLGTVHYFRGDYQEALEEDRRALALNPREPLAHNNIGVIYMNTGQPARAEDEFRLELESNPEYDNALANLGILRARAGRADEAAAFWRRAIAVSPGHLNAREHLATYLLNKGDIHGAMEQANEIEDRGGRLAPEFLNALAGRKPRH